MRTKLRYDLGFAFVLIFTSVLFMNFISSMYAGETQVYTNDLGKENLNYLIIDNTSELTKILPNITINLTNITISIPFNMPPNSFKIVFLENQTIVQTIKLSSGGGTKTITKYVNNTEYVPEYIEVPNNTIEYVENKTTEYKDIIKNKIPILGIILMCIEGIFLIILIVVLFRSSNSYEEENTDERRLENGRN